MSHGKSPRGQRCCTIFCYYFNAFLDIIKGFFEIIAKEQSRFYLFRGQSFKIVFGGLGAEVSMKKCLHNPG